MASTKLLVKPPALVDDGLHFDYKNPLLDGINLTGFEDRQTKRLKEAQHILRKGRMSTIKPLLPLMLSLKGEPYTLQRLPGKAAKHSPGYAPFETFYRTRTPRKTLYKTGRQVAKSTNLAARGIIHSACVPFFNTLYVTPLFEMVRRFSQNYIGPFIETSPIRGLLTGTSSNGSVLQRSFVNHARMIFSFAFLSADRTRGVSADKCSFDEIQDLDKDFLPIIYETMSGSKYGGIVEEAGTPKGLENTIEAEWQTSSQAEWVIKCHRCSYWNVPALSHDLDEMIGPWREDISYERPAVVCAKCKKYIYPHTGRWVHALPERHKNRGGRWDFAGFHIPQFIMPMHYANPEKWAALVAKRSGAGNTPMNVFYNEVCGESYDTGSRIITLTDLKAASNLPWVNTLASAKENYDPGDYIFRALGVDWGGGGEDGMSYTCYAVIGMKPDGRLEVVFGYRSLTPHDHEREAKLALGLASQFSCHVIAHDYTGAGALRETFIAQAGWPLDRILPVAYVRAASTSRVMTFKPPTKNNPRPHYQVDKSRSLLLTCNQIKNQWIRFFQYDYESSEDTGMIYDFLALVDEKVDSRIGKDIYTIIRDPNMRDDFAQAVNIGACSIWQATDKWPNIASVAGLRVPQAVLDAIAPEGRDAIDGLI